MRNNGRHTITGAVENIIWRQKKMGGLDKSGIPKSEATNAEVGPTKTLL